MAYKACKYCQVTQIQWDTELNAFRESDGKLHDRKRCEGIRNGSDVGSGSNGRGSWQQQQAQPQQPQGQSRYETSYLIPREDWIKLMATIGGMNVNVENIIQQLTTLSEYYQGLLEYTKGLTSTIRNEQKLADSEAQYDQDKEDGLV